MAVSSKKIVVTLLRIAICIAALWWVLESVKWHDYINLSNGTSAYLVKAQNDSFQIKTFDDQTKTIGLDEVARNKEGDPEITYGLRSVVFESQWIYFLYALLIYTPVTFIQAFRFRMVFRSQDIALTYGESLKLCFAGNFLNFVALGSTGGDVVKAYYVCQKTDRKTEAITTLFLDRVIGLLGLLIAVGFSIVLFSQDGRLRILGYMIATILLVLSIGSIIMASNRVRRIWWKLIPGFARRIWESAHPETAEITSRHRIRSMFQWGMIQLRKVDQSAQRFLRHGGMLAAAIGLSVTLQFVVLAAAQGVVLALRMPWTWSMVGDYFAFIGSGNVISALPITPQGVGTVEAFYKEFLVGPFGSVSQILCLAMGIRLLMLTWSLPGVLVVMTGPFHKAKKENPESLS